MKTTIYNPSNLELEFSKAILDLKDEIQKKVTSTTILEVENRSKEDNPSLVFKLQDKDGDKHEIVLRLIQRIE